MKKKLSKQIKYSLYKNRKEINFVIKVKTYNIKAIKYAPQT